MRVRSFALLALPLLAACSGGGKDPRGVDRNESACTCEPPLDPRWSVLDELRTSDLEES